MYIDSPKTRSIWTHPPLPCADPAPGIFTVPPAFLRSPSLVVVSERINAAPQTLTLHPRPFLHRRVIVVLIRERVAERVVRVEQALPSMTGGFFERPIRHCVALRCPSLSSLGGGPSVSSRGLPPLLV